MFKSYILLLVVLSIMPLLYAQELSIIDNQPPLRPHWQAHLGLGVGIAANGLPSQLANNLAKYEHFVTSISNPRGLPLFVQLFGGLSYNLALNHQLGMEIALSLGMDGGSARVTLNSDPKNIPGYVYDSAYGSSGDSTLSFPTIALVYPKLSTINTLKGYYLDPKLRLYYRYHQPSWSLQAGIGAGIMLPFGYFAYPSKNINDYKGPFVGPLKVLWQDAIVQGPIGATRIPFPLATRHGKIMMRAIQPLCDLHIRAAFHHYFVDISYATEFHYIHHLKIGLGVQFMQQFTAR